MNPNAGRVMVIGAGAVGARAFHYMAANPSIGSLCLVSRDQTKARQVANTARLGAAQRGRMPQVSWHAIDVFDREATADCISKFEPDVILSAVSLQTWSFLLSLPETQRKALEAAQFGPWLPMHLAPTRAVMQAVKESGRQPVVVNAAFPDATAPMLHAEGLAPHLGIGNIGLNVPALALGVAQHLEVPYDRVQVFCFGHHYSAHLFRTADFDAPILFRACVDGEDVTNSTPFEELRARLSSEFDRVPGVEGQANVASAAAGAAELALMGGPVRLHSPGALGMPGGYAVQLENGKVSLDLPPGIVEAQAEEVNLAGQRLDGITSIDDGKVIFEDWAADVLAGELGYDVRSFHVSDVEEVAQQLGDRMAAYVAQAF